MMRPPRGVCAFMIRIASCVQRNAPVRFVSTTAFHCSNVRSSIGIGGVPMPALLNSRSRRPNRSLVFANSARTEAGSVTSVGTAMQRDAGGARAVDCGLEEIRAPPGEHDAVAVFDKGERHRLADAGACTRHDGNLCGSATGVFAVRGGACATYVGTRAICCH